MFALLFIGAHNLVAQPYGLAARPAVGPFLNNVLPEAAPIVSGNWSTVPAFPNLYFTNAVGLTHVLGTTQLCVWEREGRVWTFANSSNVTQKKLVLDISNQCQGWDDSGLLGLAFHPGFATNHFMFVYYVWVVPGTVAGDMNTRPTLYVPGAYHDRLSRFTLDTNGVAIAGSELTLVNQTGDHVWHNGGGMFFHPTNGFLYWTDGDDNDNATTQIIHSNLFSGVFRIDVDKRGGAISHPIPRQPAVGVTTNYYIPNDNPFVGQSNVLEEFFCLGLRSPHRMTIDPPSGRIFIGDVGFSTREEVDIIEPGESGLNFQWSTIEGLQGDLTPPYVGINRRPVLDYTHSDGIAVIGGYVYRGSEFASDLAGKYIFGDNGARVVWVLDESTTPAGKIPLATIPKGDGPNSGNDYTGLSSFGLDANNEIYMCQMSSVGGRIFKLSRAEPAAPLKPLPVLLSLTAAFTNLATLAPNPGFIPYNVNSPLWSDNAIKTRWISLPTNSTIDFAPTGEWNFPDGTVFLKHFELSVNDTNPAIRKRLETRLLVRDTNGFVYGASYRWRADQSDADLVLAATNVIITITNAAGTRTQTWSFPGRQDCLRCHTTVSGGVLGVKTRQQNGTNTYPTTGITDNQLRTWSHIGMFSAALNEASIPGYTKLVTVTDTNATIEFRSRSYLDANCSQCHRPGGVPALFDARFDTPLENQGLLNGAVVNALGIAGAKVIAPGFTNKSILFQRDNSVGNIQMPPLAKNVVDTNAMIVIAAWIAGLPPVTNNLPTPWNHTDIGDAAAVPGDATVALGQFTVDAAGSDISNNADGLHFVYQAFTNDGQIVARVAAVENTDPWAKAGVMFRENLAAGSKHAFMAITPGKGAAFVRRTVTDGATANTTGPNVIAPYWVRLVRAGNIFTGFISPEGTNWTFVGSTTNVVSSQIYAGLAVTAHENSVLNSSVFDNISVVPKLTVTVAADLTNVVPGQSVQFTSQAGGGQPGRTPFDLTEFRNDIVSAQGENNFDGATEVATNAFDNNLATKWLDFATNNPDTRASWIQSQCPNAMRAVVTQYTVTSANDSPERDPSAWRLLGSNNGGANWTMLDLRTNQVFTARFQTQSFSFTNTNAFNLHRFQIDSVEDPGLANSVQLAELEFIGLPVYSYAWTFGDGTTSTNPNPQHAYATNGNFTATLAVADGVDTATNFVTVTSTAPGTNAPLAVTIAANPASLVAGLSVQFNAQASGGQPGRTPFDLTDAHAGNISAQGQNSAFGEVATNAFDNDSATKWLDFATNNPATRASWIQFQMSNATRVVVSQYTITSANDSPERDPSAWRLLGSNNGGTNWTTLDLRANQIFTARFQTQSFSFTNTNAFNLHRFQIDSVATPGSANSVQLAELEFIGLPVYTYSWTFGDGTTNGTQNPLHVYAAHGTFSARVIAADGTGKVTNTVSVTVTSAPPVTFNPPGLTNKNFRLTFNAISGVPYTIEASTNLKTWASIFTNTATNSAVQFIDLTTTNRPLRFYRARTE